MRLWNLPEGSRNELRPPLLIPAEEDVTSSVKAMRGPRAHCKPMKAACFLLKKTFLWFVMKLARIKDHSRWAIRAPQSWLLQVPYFMLCNLQVFASGPRRSRLESAVYIPHVWLLSNIVFLITNDAAISDKHKKDKHSLLSVICYADARTRNSCSSTPRSETFSYSTMLAQHWGHPSCIPPCR